MSFHFQVTDFYTVKEEGWYPWPWPGDLKREIKLYPDTDILTKDPKEGTYTTQTGAGCFGITLRDDQVIFHQGETKKLSML